MKIRHVRVGEKFVFDDRGGVWEKVNDNTARCFFGSRNDFRSEITLENPDAFCYVMFEGREKPFGNSGGRVNSEGMLGGAAGIQGTIDGVGDIGDSASIPHEPVASSPSSVASPVPVPNITIPLLRRPEAPERASNEGPKVIVVDEESDLIIAEYPGLSPQRLVAMLSAEAIRLIPTGKRIPGVYQVVEHAYDVVDNAYYLKVMPDKVSSREDNEAPRRQPVEELCPHDEPVPETDEDRAEYERRTRQGATK
jgi:hypothetical protein